MKQEHWKKFHLLWESKSYEQESLLQLEQPGFSKWKQIFKHSEIETQQDISVLPATKQELKQHFLNRLFPFQLKWASSTVTNVSFIDRGIENDQTLQYFLQRFPDSYFVMYYPVFKIQNASMDGEIIFIGPLGLEIIYLLEKENGTIYAVDDRTWIFSSDQEQWKFVSPLIALKRTEKIISSMLKSQGVNFPVTKTILSRTNHIDSARQIYNFNIIDKTGYEKWFQEKRHLTTPLKNRQLKTAEVLLSYCQTTSVQRPE